MNNSEIVTQVLEALESERATPVPEGTGLRTPAVRAISRQQYPTVKPHGKDEIFICCEQLLATRDVAARMIAFDWAFRCQSQYLTADFTRFELWLRQYVNGWGSCDDFCTHAFGALLYRFPNCLPGVKLWTQSDNCWLRRAAAVVLIYAVRRQTLYDAAFEVADLLLLDEDDLVQKGYGWLLKEVSNLTPMPVFDYVMLNKVEMPRTALRYAIEKLDPTLRQVAMTR